MRVTRLMGCSTARPGSYDDDRLAVAFWVTGLGIAVVAPYHVSRHWLPSAFRLHQPESG